MLSNAIAKSGLRLKTGGKGSVNAFFLCVCVCSQVEAGLLKPVAERGTLKCADCEHCDPQHLWVCIECAPVPAADPPSAPQGCGPRHRRPHRVRQMQLPPSARPALHPHRSSRQYPDQAIPPCSCGGPSIRAADSPPLASILIRQRPFFSAPNSTASVRAADPPSAPQFHVRPSPQLLIRQRLFCLFCGRRCAQMRCARHLGAKSPAGGCACGLVLNCLDSHMVCRKCAVRLHIASKAAAAARVF